MFKFHFKLKAPLLFLAVSVMNFKLLKDIIKLNLNFEFKFSDFFQGSLSTINIYKMCKQLHIIFKF